MRRLFLTFLGCPLLCCFAAAQMSTIPAAKAIADLQGPPKNPPIFSEMTVILQGDLRYEDTVNFRGPVTSVERSNEPQPTQRPNPVSTKTILKFDESGRLVKRTNEASMGTSTATLVWEKGKLQKQEVLHHGNNVRFGDWIDWNEWIYDKGGRLSEFHSGRDKVASTDLVNFKYDAQGRLLGYELLAQEVVEIAYQSEVDFRNISTARPTSRYRLLTTRAESRI
jgi:hypothetical protein